MKKFKKKAARKLSFIVPIYGCRIFVTCGTGDERLIEKYLDLERGCLSLEYKKAAAAAIEIEGVYTQVMCIGNDKVERPVLMHECIHLVMVIFKKIGVPISYKNQESFAYTAEYVYIQVCKKLKINP